MLNNKSGIASALSLCALIVSVAAVEAFAQSAAPRPGIDRPIRVGMFKGIGGNGEVWHTNTHTASSVMASLLANPAVAGLGDSLVVPPAGFSFYSMPVALNTAGTAECSGVGCGPTPEQMVAIVASLDTLDVLIMNSNIRIDQRISDSAQRLAFETFWASKGLVSVHATADHLALWPKWDTVNGARFRGHPTEQTGTVRRDSVYAQEPQWRYLNRGIFSNAADTTFFEEWFFFTEPGTTIRARAPLKPTIKLVEASLANLGTQTPMGDHPMSWYRNWPTGGRTFYTALGHRSQTWQSNRPFRRHLYNAILWAAKYDSIVTVSVGPRAPSPTSTDFARVSFMGSSLVISLLNDGPHTIEIRGLDGKRVEIRRGVGRAQHDFPGLRAGVYVVNVDAASGRSSRLVTVP